MAACVFSNYKLCLEIVSDYSCFALLLLQVGNKGSKPEKKVPAQKGLSESDYVDDDDALRQASFDEFLNEYFFPLQGLGRVAVLVDH